MSKTKFSQTVVCPNPWTAMYFHINSPSPCHIIRNGLMNMTMEEYINSEWLVDIKQKMINGIRPKECENCETKERLGLKSTRGASWRYWNIGEEPNLEDQPWFHNITVDTPTKPKRIELRFSNLCNMKCRMCDEASSSEIAKEKQKYNLGNDINNNPDNIFFEDTDESVLKITDDNIQGLKNIELLRDLRKVCFTGGEPFLIKGYYDYLDFLIEHKFNERVELELFTNTSVYNKLFVDRLMKFPKVEFTMSIDGVGKTAEYIRHGTKWATIEKNVLTFNSMPKPILCSINVAISAYVLLDVSNLALFLMRLYRENNNILIKCYTVLMQSLRFTSAPAHLKERMLREIDLAIDILDCPNFAIFRNELLNLRPRVLSALNVSRPLDEKKFIEFTQTYDKIRNESFENTFGIPLILDKEE
jgi:organic radical activating enzyme